MTRKKDKNIYKEQEKKKIRSQRNSRIKKVDEERDREKEILQNIQKLASPIIFLIYEYLSGTAKFLCNKKYAFLEKHIKNDCRREYTFWAFLNSLFEPMNKEQILDVIYKGPIRFHPSVIDRIWYNHLENNEYHTGYDLIELWKNNRFEIILNLDDIAIVTLNNNIKKRFIDSLYYYMLRIMDYYEKNRKLQANCKHLFLSKPFHTDPHVFHNIDEIFHLYKSLEYMSTVLRHNK
jgi:hypothetical protein